MPRKAFTAYAEEEQGTATLPPRSSLYAVEPVGVGTANVESMDSYLVRLAHAHGLYVRHLAAVPVSTHLSQTGETPPRLVVNNNVNGVNNRTGANLAALEALTLRTDLSALTMFPWRQVLSSQKLVRYEQAWCPLCYGEWLQTGQIVYRPLLWALDVVNYCPRHQQALVHQCPFPDCGQQLPLVSGRTKVGYCIACQRWLGEALPGRLRPTRLEADVRWQQWLTEQLGTLLAGMPHLAAVPQARIFAQNLRWQLDQSGLRNFTELGRASLLPAGMLITWTRGTTLPRLDMLLRLCFRLGWSVSSLLLPRSEPSLPSVGGPFR